MFSGFRILGRAFACGLPAAVCAACNSKPHIRFLKNCPGCIDLMVHLSFVTNLYLHVLNDNAFVSNYHNRTTSMDCEVKSTLSLMVGSTIPLQTNIETLTLTPNC